MVKKAKTVRRKTVFVNLYHFCLYVYKTAYWIVFVNELVLSYAGHQLKVHGNMVTKLKVQSSMLNKFKIT